MKMAAAHVPDEMIDALDRIAEQQGVERTKVIRWALAEYIERFSLPARPANRTTGQAAVQPTPIAETTH